MVTEAEIIQFIEKEYWKSKLSSESGVFETLRIDGDDCSELLEKYQDKYQVDMTDFLWYFHHSEEGLILRWNYFKSADEKIKRIPITVKMLTQFANEKKWNLEYPEHTMPKRRNSLIITIIYALLFLGLILILIKKYTTS